MNHEDAHRLADRLHTLATALDNDLIRALRISHDWQGHLKATALEPGGSSSVWCDTHERDVSVCQRADLFCEGETVRVNDPTGEAYVNGPLDDLRHKRLVAAVGQVDYATATLVNLLRQTCPTARPVDLSIAPDGACESCWRDNHHYEPTSEGRYKGLCRWCGEIKASYGGQLPPLEFLRRRHRGQRIGSAELDRAMRRAS